MSDESHPLEFALFALALREPGAVSYFVEHLDPGDVGALEGKAGLSEFYGALVDFHQRTGLDPVDPIAFRSWLETETEICAALGGPAGTKAFVDLLGAIELPKPESVVAILHHQAVKRRQLGFLQELQRLVAGRERKSDDDRTRILFLTDQIRALEQEIGYNPMDRVVTGGDIAARADGLWELPDFLPTQFSSLNRALGYDERRGGFVKGAVHAVLAPSGMGKSTFSKCLQNYWVEQGHTVLYVNYEEPQPHWERILFTQVTGCNVFSANDLDDAVKARHSREFKEKMQRWGDRFVVRHDPDTPYFEDLELWLRDILGHNERIPDVVIIDTIQSMFTKGSGGKPRWGQYEEMMVRLEKLAKDMRCVLIITAQENTNRMKERREVVQQSDTGGSITIQQKSTATIFITEKRLASEDDSEDETIMQLQIPKNRITGKRFTHDCPLVRYDDDTKSYYPFEPVVIGDYPPDTFMSNA